MKVSDSTEQTAKEAVAKVTGTAALEAKAGKHLHFLRLEEFGAKHLLMFEQ